MGLTMPRDYSTLGFISSLKLFNPKSIRTMQRNWSQKLFWVENVCILNIILPIIHMLIYQNVSMNKLTHISSCSSIKERSNLDF